MQLLRTNRLCSNRPMPIRAAHTWQASEWKWVILYLCFPIYSLTSQDIMGLPPRPSPRTPWRWCAMRKCLDYININNEANRSAGQYFQIRWSFPRVPAVVTELPLLRIPGYCDDLNKIPQKLSFSFHFFFLSQCGKVRLRCATGICLSPLRRSRSSQIVYFCIFYFLRKPVGCCIALHAYGTRGSNSSLTLILG